MFWKCDKCGKESTDRIFIKYALERDSYTQSAINIAELCSDCGKDVEIYIRGKAQ